MFFLIFGIGKFRDCFILSDIGESFDCFIIRNRRSFVVVLISIISPSLLTYHGQISRAVVVVIVW